MKLALDTNRYTDLMVGVPDVVKTLEQATAIYVPFVTIAELRGGFSLGSKGRANEAILTRFLSRPDVVMLFPDDGTTRYYAEAYRFLRARDADPNQRYLDRGPRATVRSNALRTGRSLR